MSIVSCGNCDDFTQETIDYFNKKGVHFDHNLKNCIIIPDAGCSGCISTGIFFVKKNISKLSKDQTSNVVIFTNVVSNKLLKRNFEKDEWEALNKMVDSTNMYHIEGANSIYPLILYLENGEILKAEVQSPKLDAFSNLCL